MGVVALTDDERKDLTDPRADFTAEERVVIAMTYILTGENAGLAASRASKNMGKDIPAGTLRQWRRRPWWLVAETAAKKRLQVELENGYTRILHLTEKSIIDRVENGDSRMTKDGELVTVPVTLRDLIGAHAIIAEQRGRIRGEPGSRKEDTGLALAIKLAEAFHRMGQEAMKAGSIPGEYVVVDPGSAEIGDNPPDAVWTESSPRPEIEVGPKGAKTGERDAQR